MPVKGSGDLSSEAQVSLGGALLGPEITARLLEVRVETTVGLPDVCTIRLAEEDTSAGSGELPIIDNAKFKLGAPLKVKLAAAVGGQLGDVFDGEVTGIEAELGMHHGEQIFELVVVAHDRSHRMHRKTPARTFRQVTVGDVAKKMAGEHGLKVGTIATLPGGPHEVLHQVGETDWAFLSRLIREHGGELDIAGGAMHVNDPSKAKAAVAKLVTGEDLLRLRARISSLGQVETVDVRGWDPAKKAEITATAKPKAATKVEASAVNGHVGGTKVMVPTARVSTANDAKGQAAGLAQRIGHERVQADALAAGNPKLLAGESVDITGAGKRFSGTHRIVSAVHLLSASGYQVRLVLGAGGRPLAQVLNQGTTSDFASHLAVGLVTSNSDPDKLGRVKVKYPALAETVESGWVRVARGASGKERGAVALPDVNDEVVVGFEHGDVHRPFVLGVLFNGKDKPGPDLVKAANSYTARFPRVLDVLTKETTVVEAQKGHKVTSKQGPIELIAGKAITIKASQGGPPSAVTIETTGQIKANGKQGVEIAASGPLKITSSAPVTIESNAVLQLKGSIVQVKATGVLQLSGATVMIG